MRRLQSITRVLFKLQPSIIIFPFDTSLPIRNYTKEQRDFLLYGTAFPDFVKAHKNIKEPKKVSDGKFEGIVPYLLSRYKSNPDKLPNDIKKYISCEPCCACHNTRLGKIGRGVTINGKTIIDVAELTSMRSAWMDEYIRNPSFRG